MITPAEETNEETIETQETETPEEKTTEEGNTSEKPEETLEDVTAKNKKLYARAKTAEEGEKKAKENLEKLKLDKKPNETQEQWQNKVNFLLQSRDSNYSEDEFNHISAVANRDGKTLSDAAKSEKEYISYKREKVAKENKVPAPSSPSGIRSDSGKKLTEKLDEGDLDGARAAHEKFAKEYKEEETRTGI